MTTLAPDRAPRERRLGSSALRHVPLVVVAGIAAVAVLLALFGPLLAPYDPDAQDLLTGATLPGPGHVLGTDDVGRDVLSRLIVGARSAVVGPVVIALGSLLLGSCIGLVAGYLGGTVGSVLMRAVDLVYSLPALLVALVVGGVLGGGYWLAVALLIILFSPFDARVVRGATLEQRGRPYVEAARLLGVPRWRIMLLEIWPNVRPVELANAFLNFSYGLVYLTALSFLGIGVPPGTADWGRMLAEGISYLELNPWGALAPGLAILLVAASVTLLGDRLEEYLADRGRVR